MKKTTKLKALVLSAMMLACMLVPTSAKAQNDNFIPDIDNGNRFEAEWTIINNGIGQSEAPLGSGLLILSAVGAGYAVARRKRHNGIKGIKAIIIITALIGVTSCRKNLDTVNEVAQHGVYITLNVDGGEKVAVTPTGGDTYATVTWEDDDILYVGNNGKYCGYLEYDGTKFGGTISPTSDGDYLHFYFMGNKGTTSEPTSVNITDQTSKYPVISYGRSTTRYNSGTTSYSATLYNKCAIVKFPISGAGTDENITLRGMNNTVTVNFAANNGATTGNPYTFSKTGYGEITLHAESATEKWAIVLPQDAVDAKLYADGYNTETVSVPAIDANTYHNNDISEITLTAGEPSDLFSVASDKKVRFSPGNLQYKAGEGWRFAEHQYDYIGAWNTSDWVDLFGWGTWGEGKNPLNESTTNGDYQWSTDFKGTLNGHSDWFTLSYLQWRYIFNHSTKGWSTVAGVNGYVLRPDGNTTDVASSYTAEAWAVEEASGSVFLPAAGGRLGSGVDVVGGYGYYWSSTAGGVDYAWYVNFDENGADMSSIGRILGFSVRLVR